MFGLTPFENRSYDMFRTFRDFEREFFGDNTQMINAFRTDVQDAGDHFVLEAELPGFQKDEINIDVQEDCLTIAAEHATQNDEKDDKGNYLRRERSYGTFRRSFGLENIDAQKVAAKYQNGILTLTLPKKEPQKPVSRRLEIMDA